MTTDESAEPAWVPVCRRGQFALKVLTRVVALRQRRTMRPTAMFVCEVRPDDGQAVDINFMSLENIAVFIAEMRPHWIQLCCDVDEDAKPMLAALQRAGATVQ